MKYVRIGEMWCDKGKEHKDHVMQHNDVIDTCYKIGYNIAG